jgi:hypothetical protein
LEPWLELIYKKAKSELSPAAEKLRYNLVYYGLRYPNEDNGLASDMNNSRKPDSPDYANVDKLIKFMRANRLAKPADLKNALAQKWDAINTKEQQSAKDQQPVAEDTGANIPPVLYHATYKQRLKSIQLKGLGAGSKRNWTDSKRGVVYLALDPDVAESYAETSDMVPDEWLDSIVILKISTSGLDTNKFQLDRNVLDNEGDTLEYHGIIPPGNISLYKPSVAEDTVDEMALSTYKTMGDFDKPGPFTGADKKLVPHAKNIEKATKFFEQTPYDFRLFFSNIPGTGKYGEYGPMTPDQIRKIFGADAEEIIQGSEDAITVVYVGNRGEAKVMLTPWVMAHRLGHAIQAGARGTRAGHVWTAAEKHFFTTVNSTLAEHYGKVDRGPSSYLGRPKAEQANINLTPEYNALFNAIGTQRSSRSGQILRPYEFLYEIFAQYLGTGRITFNPFPANLTYGRKAFGNPTKFMNIKPEYRDEFSRKEAADRLAYDMELMFDSVLAGSVGKILVM